VLKSQFFSSTSRAAGPSSSLVALDYLLFEARFLCDSRRARGVRYRLGDVLAVIVVGVLCGNDDAEAISQWAGHERDWLMEHVPGLDGRIPSQDTILRTLALIRVDVFSELLRRWTQKFFGPNALEAGHIAIDGKTKRSATKRNTSGSSVHAIAAVMTGARIVLAECAVDTKANEITAAPDLLRALELRGALVSGDAMYTQTALAEQIVQAGGDYFLQVKRNQPTLQQEMTAVFLDAFDAQKHPEPIADRPGIKVHFDDVEKGHGRLEQRITVVASMEKKRMECAGRWKALAALVLVFRWRVDLATSNVSFEPALFITSRRMDAKTANDVARAHWGIETYHHILDVSYGEDASRVANENAAHNLGMVRRLVQNLLSEVEPRRSVPYKRRECSHDPEFRLRVLDRRPQ
jgi:predicted transposase YbfD/YdcC